MDLQKHAKSQQIELNLLQLQSYRHKKSCILGSTHASKQAKKKTKNPEKWGEVKSFRNAQFNTVVMTTLISAVSPV